MISLAVARLHRSRARVRWQIRIEETECMRELNHAHAGGSLFLQNLIAQRLHAGPMDLRPEVMFRVITVIKPGPVVELIVAAYAPGERLVRITAIVPIEPIQIGQAVPEIIKRKKETNVTPVEKAKNHEGGKKKREFQDTPESLTRILAFQFLEDRFGVLAEETEESIFEGMLRGSIVAMFVNRDPVHRPSISIG